MPIDGKTASQAAKEYFKAVSDPIGFQIEKVSKNDSGLWEVLCDFWPYVGAVKRAAYLVRVDGDGAIQEVALQ